MDYEALMRRFERAKNDRANFESVWQEIAERVWPSAADFTVQQTPGARRTEKMFDPTPALSAQKAISAIASFAWPSNQQYQRITTTNAALNRVQSVRVWMDDLTNRIFAARYSPRAAFESQMSEVGLSSFCFGTGLMFVDENIEKRTLRYKALPLSQTYIIEGADGKVDTLYRCFKWSVRQIAQKWPNGLNDKLRERLRDRPDEMIEVSHFVGPREDFEPGATGNRGLPIASVYYIADQKHVLDEGGFRCWPFGIHRYMTSPSEVYGRGPAWLALPSIKVLNVQKKTLLQAGQKVVDPPLLASEDGILSAFSQVPGAVNMGALDSQGNELVKPLITNARVDIGLDMMDRERDIIAGAFMMDVFRVLIEHPNMTATQTIELLNERAVIMAPIVGRYESEFFSPVTEREIDLLVHAGQIDQMPPELIEAQGEYKIEFTSPMRRAMRSSEAIAITRTLESITPMAQVDASVLDAFDLPEMARELADINGVPAHCIRDAEALAAMKQQRATDAQTAQLLQAAPMVSQTAANLAKLQASGGLQPGLGG
ncbi:MAG: hypothetical protein RLZZ373_2685 [Pseudomonadota bacterium]|jgi:hypothetical protein